MNRNKEWSTNLVSLPIRLIDRSLPMTNLPTASRGPSSTLKFESLLATREQNRIELESSIRVKDTWHT